MGPGLSTPLQPLGYESTTYPFSSHAPQVALLQCRAPDPLLLTTHCLLRTTYYSLFTHHYVLLTTCRSLYFRVELQILHGLYTTNIDLFESTLTLDILPEVERGDPRALERSGDRNVWVAAVDILSTVADPMNMPRLAPTLEHYPGSDYLYPHAADNRGAYLDYSMMDHSSYVFIDPLQGPSSVLVGESYWLPNLFIAPMHYLPYFSHCVGGYKIGRPPGEARDFTIDELLNFHIGAPATMGGFPRRERGQSARCTCRGATTYELACPPVGGDVEYSALDCAWELDGDGNQQFGLDHERVTYPDTGSTESDIFRLRGQLLVDPACSTCAAADDGGAAAGERYPFWPRSLAEDGSVERLSGWDSHAPLFWVLENPSACFLVACLLWHAHTLAACGGASPILTTYYLLPTTYYPLFASYYSSVLQLNSAQMYI